VLGWELESYFVHFKKILKDLQILKEKEILRSWKNKTPHLCEGEGL